MPQTITLEKQISALQSRLDKLKVVALAGGVGGAKLVDGLAQIVPPENLTVIVNTGDDFCHCGLKICPDLDTVMYTLAGVANPELGWGRMGDSWRTLEEVSRLQGPTWFRLGDLDLATHLTRSHILEEGRTLTEATQHLCRGFGIKLDVLPMSNEAAPTGIECDEGILAFQTWFVARQWQPAVRRVLLPEDVRTTSQVMSALEEADLIAIAPSNPFVSIEPILNVYPIQAMIADLPELVVAVSPIVGGQAIKGPAAKMMMEMGIEVSSAAVAARYGDLIDVFVHDRRDEIDPGLPGLVKLQTDTIMKNRDDRLRLAYEIVSFSLELLDQ